MVDGLRFPLHCYPTSAYQAGESAERRWAAICSGIDYPATSSAMYFILTSTQLVAVHEFNDLARRFITKHKNGVQTPATLVGRLSSVNRLKMHPPVGCFTLWDRSSVVAVLHDLDIGSMPPIKFDSVIAIEKPVIVPVAPPPMAHATGALAALGAVSAAPAQAGLAGWSNYREPFAIKLLSWENVWQLSDAQLQAAPKLATSLPHCMPAAVVVRLPPYARFNFDAEVVSLEEKKGPGTYVDAVLRDYSPAAQEPFTIMMRFWSRIDIVQPGAHLRIFEAIVSEPDKKYLASVSQANAPKSPVKAHENQPRVDLVTAPRLPPAAATPTTTRTPASTSPAAATTTPAPPAYPMIPLEDFYNVEPLPLYDDDDDDDVLRQLNEHDILTAASGSADKGAAAN